MCSDWRHQRPGAPQVRHHQPGSSRSRSHHFDITSLGGSVTAASGWVEGRELKMESPAKRAQEEGKKGISG